MSSENQETFAWDSASVADDGRTVTVSGIHPPGADDAWAVTDRHQSAVVSLPAPLGNRVLVDGNARLAEATEIAITVWQRAGGRAVARYWAAIVQLGEPIAGRRIVDGAVRVSSR